MQKKRGRSKEIALELLKILEEETDKEHLLSKEQLIQAHYDEYRWEDGKDPIGEKTFYAKIDEIHEAGFPVRRTKGKWTKYCLDDVRLTGEELLFLVSMIKSSPDLGEEEAETLANKLLAMRVHQRAKEYVEEHASIVEEHHNPAPNQIRNYAVLLGAIGNAGKVTCKFILSREGGYRFSETRTIRPRAIGFTREGARVTFDENGVTQSNVPLRDLVNIEPE